MLCAGVTLQLNQTLDMSRHIQGGLVFVLVCMQFVPLVWAYTDGIRVIGAELVFKPGIKARLARQWAETLWVGASSLTVLAGRDPASDTHIFAVPTDRPPPARTIAHSISARKRMQRAGVACAWLSLAEK